MKRIVDKKKRSAYDAARYVANREKVLESRAARYYPDPEKSRAIAKAYSAKRRGKQQAYREANREFLRAGQARYRAQYPERCKAAMAAWDKAYPEKAAARAAKRRALRQMATPEWGNTFFIGEAYDLAKRRTKSTGYKWHVDHSVPLKSRWVCGLHVEHNLQVIPATRNISKGNRRWPDMPGEFHA